MPLLSASDMTKQSSSGDYAGTKRPDIFAAKIKDKKTFRLATETGKEVVGVEYNKTTETLTYYEKSDPKKTIKTIKRSQVWKDKDFGGGSGSGGGAADTALTESLQCFYCAYVFNTSGLTHPCKSVTDAQLKATAQYAKTDKTLADCLSKGPKDWIANDVYLKTANKLYEKYKNRVSGKVYFHRGSAFMNAVYDAKKKCHDNDRASGKPQAPGSFSNDKWNPGDIWMSTFEPSTKPLEKFTNGWGELNAKVLELAGGGLSGTGTVKLLGISLKKIPSTQATANLQEFSTPAQMAQRSTYKWQSWSFGKTGAFFDSQDVYVRISGKEVQFRTFGGDTSWQGEIKGTAAAGGKIGGGNVNFYVDKIFGKNIYNGKTGKTAESQFLAEVKLPTFNLAEKMYDSYKTHNQKSTPSKELIGRDEFITRVNSMDSNFTNSKILCLNFLDAVLSGNETQRNEFATELFRYASSDTDQSSYFVKLY